MLVQLYHNPNCSKSRQTLALLQQQGIEPEIICYLSHRFNLAELTRLKQQLQFSSVRQMMRVKEQCYEQLGLHNEHLSEQDLLQAIIQNPILLERPIVVKGEQAKIGRPPEAVLALFTST
ncbi:arsenate reductase (glutaredoxin) [Volucribacter amazonae]|uniref:Arsenate reductase n=1 Tax=Volucribacter amazonae TaxID=256731 RepID=A0A9X4PD55_9PAST|nr:arsenate reductase (glutaredoxin) [Volucribacter amazonae]MDG6895982.1 arsenate reductase (glutaredoxin) [Volucribacter amazonae]